METSDGRSSSRRRRLVGLVVLIGLAGAGGLWAARGRWYAGRHGSRTVSLHTPYRNARPGVAYVGDAACARCHREIAASFARHPMGRSLATADRAPEREVGGEEAARSFVAQGLHYAVERRGGRLIHSEEKRDARGKVVARAEAEVRYVLGSGARGLSYLVDRDGYLFQSPIGWFAQERRWDLSPGYAARNLHFERPIETECLFCHANRAEAVAGTVNRYREPIFRGLAIGCERCHGPGALHARDPGTRDADGRDLTIVNPRHLEPSLREAVCEQCHLQGVYHVERAGRRATDYRPGLPLEAFLAVFVRSGPTGGNQAVGHVEQMHASRCYRAGEGRLGCISCHDPHRLPEPEERAAFYRGRCLSCHADRGCTLPEAERRGRAADDSCIACHMPRAPLADIAHTATTDHRIPRREGRASPLDRTSPDEPGLPLALFHAERFAAEDSVARGRDLGVALAHIARGAQGPMGARFSRLAWPRLEEAVRAEPDDVDAREALAFARALLGRTAEALEATKEVLAVEPGRERALDLAMVLASQLRRRDEALGFGRRTLAVDPWVSRYHLGLAQVASRGEAWTPGKGDWRQVAASCRAALRLDPMNVEARRLLIVAAALSGDLPGARDGFAAYAGFDPPDAESLRRWLR